MQNTGSVNSSSGEVANIVKRDLQEIHRWAAKQSKDLSKINWQKVSARAKDILTKIQMAEKQLLQDATFQGRLGQSLKTQNKYLNEVRHAQTLQIYLTQGYIFLKEFKKMLTGEVIEYLILFDDGQKSEIGVYALKDLLPTLMLAVNADGSFSLQIKRAQELKKLKDKKSKLSETGKQMANEIITLYRQIWAANIEVTKERRQKKAREAGEKDWEKIGGYARGQAGKSFEISANQIAKKVYDAITTHQETLIEDARKIAEQHFHADTQAFYKAGDMAKELSQLFVKTKNVVLELKRVSTSENTVGAPLASQAVIQHGLQEVIRIIDTNQTDKEILQNLQEMFKTKENDIGKKVETSADNIAQKEIDKELKRIGLLK